MEWKSIWGWGWSGYGWEWGVFCENKWIGLDMDLAATLSSTQIERNKHSLN